MRLARIATDRRWRLSDERDGRGLGPDASRRAAGGKPRCRSVHRRPRRARLVRRRGGRVPQGHLDARHLAGGRPAHLPRGAAPPAPRAPRARGAAAADRLRGLLPAVDALGGPGGARLGRREPHAAVRDRPRAVLALAAARPLRGGPPRRLRLGDCRGRRHRADSRGGRGPGDPVLRGEPARRAGRIRQCERRSVDVRAAAMRDPGRASRGSRAGQGPPARGRRDPGRSRDPRAEPRLAVRPSARRPRRSVGGARARPHHRRVLRRRPRDARHPATRSRGLHRLEALQSAGSGLRHGAQGDPARRRGAGGGWHTRGAGRPAGAALGAERPQDQRGDGGRAGRRARRRRGWVRRRRAQPLLGRLRRLERVQARRQQPAGEIEQAERRLLHLPLGLLGRRLGEFKRAPLVEPGRTTSDAPTATTATAGRHRSIPTAPRWSRSPRPA